MSTRVGVMGGTFDPVHLGHLAVAEEARTKIGLSQVLFIPAGHPYFKALARISPAEQRVQMLKLALKGHPHFKLSLMEIQRPGPTYAVDTLAALKTQLEASDELCFILGWDALLTLPQWQSPQRLIELCHLVVAPRPGYNQSDLDKVEKELPGIKLKTHLMDHPMIDISSTAIRERVRRGLPIDDQVPPEVARYIREKGIYQEKALDKPAR